VTVNVTAINHPPVISCTCGSSIYVGSNSTFVVMTGFNITDDLPASVAMNVTMYGSNPNSIVNVTALNLTGNIVTFIQNLGNLPAILEAGITYNSSTLLNDLFTITAGDNGFIGAGGPMSATKVFNFTTTSSSSLNSTVLSATGAMVGATGLFSLIGGAIYAYMRKKKMIPAEDTDPWANDQMFENQLDNPVYSSNPSDLQSGTE